MNFECLRVMYYKFSSSFHKHYVYGYYAINISNILLPKCGLKLFFLINLVLIIIYYTVFKGCMWEESANYHLCLYLNILFTELFKFKQIS